MGLVLSDEDLSAVHAFDISMGTVLSLMNDYFSWAMEAGQDTDRVRNGVHVLMKQHGLSADVARSTLLGMMVEEEAHAVRLREHCLRGSVSDGLHQYIEAMELYVGGASFWTATAPRYQMVEVNLH
ncbi:uncharacterized protein A1O9_08411 [Exophiala aquamarina CBS 119918]|uniref:Terpene synthase n=1 Tax=Exophiala aquamarina CBS 119918 TaxID=1182545 RepID=A0A072P742_9EURO|nr:uncharacterized protein A1O9_08411 [Exophiala aquamarina CBS 119918]KEF55661.1 hypothetical protein A1O9_08411 [Exophiala aquamarina CBS 119918]